MESYPPTPRSPPIQKPSAVPLWIFWSLTALVIPIGLALEAPVAMPPFVVAVILTVRWTNRYHGANPPARAPGLPETETVAGWRPDPHYVYVLTHRALGLSKVGI